MATEERTLTAYQCFFKQTFAKLKVAQEKKLKGQAWASADTQVVVKEVGKQWRELTDEQKKKYEGQMTTMVKPKASKKRKATKDAEPDPEPVEKTLTAYQCFFKQTFAKLKVVEEKKLKGKAWASANTQVVVKQVGEQWGKLNDAQKKKYEGQMTTLIKPKTKKGKKAKSDKPPRKMSAYNVYVRENSQGKGAGAAERMKQIGEKWKSMNDKAKAQYQRKADKLNESRTSGTRQV